jgi:hypothetical protein
MSLQNFVDKVGPVISASWLNMVDTLATTIFQNATSNVQARTALFNDSPLEILNGGTGIRNFVCNAGSFVVTTGGLLVPQNLTVNYVQLGTAALSTVTINIPFIQGTSNSNAFYLTGLPTALTPTTGSLAYQPFTIGGEDNGISTPLSEVGIGTGTGGLSALVFLLNGLVNGWTPSGIKASGAATVTYILG